MQLKIGKNEIEFLKKYPRCKGPHAKEIAKKLEAIGYTCWEYGGSEDHYQCSIVPYCGPITSHVLIDVFNDHFCYATKFNFRVVKNIDQEIPHGVFDGWNVIPTGWNMQGTSYVNNFDFKEEFFVEYRDWFIRKMKEKDLAIVSLNADLEDEHALEEMHRQARLLIAAQRQARLNMIKNGTFMSEYKTC